MRIILHTLGFFGILVASAATAQAQGTLLWSDEFDTASNRPDSSIWSFDVGQGVNGWGNGELQTYTDASSNTIVENGLLKIIARKDESSSPPSFTSARIKTEDKLSFKYGTLEARIQWPDLDAGLWPALWTMGSNIKTVGWPAAGEINIMEGGQGLAIDAGIVNKRVVSAAHWEYQGEYATYAKGLDFSSDLTQDFHIYKMEWTPFMLTTYVDDVLIWEMNIDKDSCEDCEELHQQHFLLLNLAVGGGFTSGGSSSSSAEGSSSSGCGGSSSAGSSSSGGCPIRGPEDITAPFPGEMHVDWIRLYDNGFTEAEIPSNPQSTPPPVTAAQTPPPTGRPTPAPVVVSVSQTPPPTRRPTVAPLSDRGPSEEPDEPNEVDCFESSGDGSSRSGGKAGKGGKSGSRSYAGSRSGGKSGSGKGGRRTQRRHRRLSGKGGKGSEGSSDSRSGCSSPNARTSTLTSQLQTNLQASSAWSGFSTLWLSLLTAGFTIFNLFSM